MNLRDIILVARYEALMVSRGFVFRMFSVLVLVVITSFQVGKQSDWALANWSWVTMSSYMPFVNAYLFNIMQALFVIFVVSDLPGREGRWGTIESIHARPVSNRDYLGGKALGVITVFVVLALMSAVLSLFLNLVVSESPCNPLLYLFYFFTLTLPSIVFCTGFGMFCSFVLKGKTPTLFLLVAVWYGSITVLPDYLYGSFDFLGLTLPNLFSGITGHVNPGGYLLQRLSFLSAGVGFVLWSVWFTRRLPHSLPGKVRSFRWAMVFVGMGLLLGGARAGKYLRTDAVREAYRGSYDRNWKNETCRVSEHAITLKQKDSKLIAESVMTLRNPGEGALPRLVLFLNPGLRVTRVEEGGDLLPFLRDESVLLIDRELAAGDSACIRVCYAGEIDERYAYLSAPDAQYHDTRRENRLFCFGNRTAFVSDRILWLVPECGWYPVAMVDAPREEKTAKIDYTRFKLNVVTPVQRVVLSQGEERRVKDTVTFVTPRPLEGISLCAGNYTVRRTRTSGFRVELYSFREDDVVPEFFSLLNQRDVEKVLEFNIRVLRDYGMASNLPKSVAEALCRHDWCYSPDSRLILVELPLPATSYIHEAKNRSGLVQPGMLFLSERGAKMSGLPVPRRYKRMYGEKDKLTTAKEVERHILRAAIWGLNKSGLSGYTDLVEKPAISISSDRFPVFDQIYKIWILNSLGKVNRLDWSMSESEQRAWEYMQSHSLKDAFGDPNLCFDLWEKVLDMKAEELSNVVATRASMERMNAFVTGFYRGHTGEVSLEVFCSELRDSLGIDLEPELEKWYSSVRPNVLYLVRDEKIVRCEGEEGVKYIGEFKIKNEGEDQGIVTVLVQQWRPVDYDYYKFTLEPGECKLVRLPMRLGRSVCISTGLSRNLPRYLLLSVNYTDSRYDCVRSNDTCCGFFGIDASDFAPENGEIVVDNASEQFSLVTPPRKWLKRLFPDRVNAEACSSGFDMANVTDWTRVVGSKYYGDTIRDMYYKRGGDGRYKAEWKTPVVRAGKYEIFVLIHEFYYDPGKFTIPYHYTITSGEESREVVLEVLPRQRGWASLGEFDFPAGEAKVTLDDRGEPNRFLNADAVKWVPK